MLNAKPISTQLELLELAKRDETRKSHREDQKMNFANQAAAVAPFMRPSSAKVFFGGKTLTDVTTTELRKYAQHPTVSILSIQQVLCAVYMAVRLQVKLNLDF
jgi:hypothetical protein